VVLHSDIEAVERLVQGIAEELLQVADVDGRFGRGFSAHSVLPFATTMAAGPRGC
jgi:hypothetical protein